MEILTLMYTFFVMFVLDNNYHWARSMCLIYGAKETTPLVSYGLGFMYESIGYFNDKENNCYLYS